MMHRTRERPWITGLPRYSHFGLSVVKRVWTFVLTLPIIGHLLGHSTPATTQRYSHLAENPAQGAADRISSRIADLLNNPQNVADRQ